MCEIVKGQRRAFRDQDPPRICNKSNENLKSELEFCESTATSPTILQRASSFERCFNESKHLEKGKQNQKKEKVNSIKQESTWSDSIKDSKDSAKVSNELPTASNQTNSENLIKELSDKVPSNSHHDDEVRYAYLYCWRNLCVLSCVLMLLMYFRTSVHVWWCHTTGQSAKNRA